MKRFSSLLVFTAILISASAAIMCSTNKSERKGDDLGNTLVMSASPTRIAADGTTTDVTVQAFSDVEDVATGSVTIDVARGALNGGGKQLVVELANGRGSFKYGCDARTEPACTGTQTIQGKWGSALAQANVELTTGNPTTDAGTTDSGARDSGARDSAATDSGRDASEGGTTTLDGSTDASDGGGVVGDGGDGVISVSAARTRLYAAIGDFMTVSAVVRAAPDAGGLSGRDVAFNTSLGELAPVLADGGVATVGADLSATTGDGGVAAVILKDTTGTPGVATVTASHGGASAQVSVPVVSLQQVTHQSTRCNGAACSVMGIKGSGFNETALVTFKVTDLNAQPASGVRLDFSIDNPPFGTVVSATATTDTQGLAVATVTSGPNIGAFEITAAINGPGGPVLSVKSPTIGIRGARPTNNSQWLTCTPTNVAAYASTTVGQAFPFTVNCTVALVDRFNNPVGTGTAVNFKAEAGTIPASANTQAYDPQGQNLNEGRVNVNFNTSPGTFPAVDVAPLPALPSQFPQARVAEPSVLDGALTRNPRDGLVTILAYVQGEEFFDDNNASGSRDPGEKFVDQGEPFVDSNDNGIWDPGEVYIDVNPANGSWDGPNGVWDRNTTVWTEARILYSGRPIAGLPYSYISPNPFGPIARGATQNVFFRFSDLNLNMPHAAGTSFAFVSASPSQLGGGAPVSTLADGYGFGYERKQVAVGTDGACTAATPICYWKALFYTWDPGAVAFATLTVQQGTSTGLSPATVTYRMTVQSLPTDISASGQVE